MTMVFTALAVMAGLLLFLTTLLWIAYRKLHVEEDERIDVVEQALPNNNCGACGFAGCRQFAEAIIGGAAQPGQCTVSTEAERQAIAVYVGVPVLALEKRVARVACAGGNNVSRLRAQYQGLPTCQAAALAGGGGKGCAWGCLGYGDCAQVCDFAAIQMDANRLPVISEVLCTACGDCVEVCPKDLISLHPISHRLWINCKNQAEGDAVLDYCEVACNGCGRCVADVPKGQIVLDHYLAVIDYQQADMNPNPIQRCPTGSIVWLAADGGVVKGPASVKVIRRGVLEPIES